jgi:hypothetical protein
MTDVLSKDVRKKGKRCTATCLFAGCMTPIHYTSTDDMRPLFCKIHIEGREHRGYKKLNENTTVVHEPLIKKKDPIVVTMVCVSCKARKQIDYIDWINQRDIPICCNRTMIYHKQSNL